jgi:hypothetical protein
MYVRRFVPLAVVVVALIVSSTLPAAQAPKPASAESQLLLVSFAKVRPGMMQEYIDFQIKEVMPNQRKGGGPGREAFSSGISGPPGEFVYVTPIKSLAQFDQPSPMVRALGQEGAAAMQAKTARLAEPMGTMVVRMRPDLSYVPDPKAPPAPLMIITVVDVVPGKRIEFEAFLKKDVVPAIQQAKAKSYRVSEVVYGEHTGGYITGIGYDSYEAIGKGHPFVIAFGEDGARKLEAKASGLVTKLHRFISRHRPELSWSPGTTTD